MIIVNSAKKKLLDGGIALLTDTIKAMILTATHVTNIDTQEFISQVSTNQVTGTGYTAGGVTLAGKTTTVNLTTDKVVFAANNITIANSTINGRFVAIYKDTGTPATSPIIAIGEFIEGTVSSSNGNFVITWNAGGILDLG